MLQLEEGVVQVGAVVGCKRANVIPEAFNKKFANRHSTGFGNVNEEEGKGLLLVFLGHRGILVVCPVL